MKIYIDTNWFLAFYQSVIERDAILEELRKHSALIVLTDQNIVEFRRNREKLLRTLANKTRESVQVKPWTTGLTRSFTEHISLVAAVDAMRAAGETLAQQIEKLLPGTGDPIWETFNYVLARCQVLAVNPEIVTRAHMRKLRGIPPSSGKRDTIGDEIIWECLLDQCVEDLAIVSLDGDFLSHASLLCAEFGAHKSHRSLLRVGTRLSEALQHFGGMTQSLYDAEHYVSPWARCHNCGAYDWHNAGLNSEHQKWTMLCGSCRQQILIT